MHSTAETAGCFNAGQIATECAGRMAVQEGKVSTTSSRRDRYKAQRYRGTASNRRRAIEVCFSAFSTLILLLFHTPKQIQRYISQFYDPLQPLLQTETYKLHSNNTQDK